MKFYIHCQNLDFTIVVVWDKDGTIRDIVDLFKENIKSKFPNKYNVGNMVLQVTNSIGKKLEHSSSVAKVIKHMDDVYVKIDVTEVELVDEMKQLKVTEVKKSDNLLTEKSNSAIIHIGNGCYRKAIEIYKEMLRDDQNNRSAILGLVTCYKRAGRYKESLSWAKKGFNLYTEDVELMMTTGECYVDCGFADKATEILMKCSKFARNAGGMTAQKKEEIQVLLAKACLLRHEKDMAITLLQGVIRNNFEHDEALVLYGDLLFPLGPEQREEAMSVMLTVLARNKNHELAKVKFAKLCREEMGMNVLMNVIAPIKTDSSALVFLANCLRDYGTIKESIQLLDIALKASHCKPGVLLLYIHILENICDYKEITSLYKIFFQEFANHHIGTFRCSVLCPVVTCLSSDFSSMDTEPVVSMETIEPPVKDYTDDEKYILAILFTFVKLLYVRGILACIPDIVTMLQPLYVDKNLHLSFIRNEAAYFKCISELFTSYNTLPSARLLSSERFIYMIGDSHCVTPAWQKIHVSGTSYIIHPVLITGLKIWHIRDDGCFYPKKHFYTAIKAIPNNAVVIVCLGEIDCREALLRCWEKARYDTIEDGMETLTKIYLQVMKSLQQNHHWKIFFHPVLPVLDITRPIVMQFNRILATKLLTEPSFHWLNFVKDLLSEGEESLKEEFVFDGTHVHPKYVSLIADTLSELM
ncbi:hypothetical protein ACF0H5_010898 [Mactra antiquata]